jgi:hypothetical protein
VKEMTTLLKAICDIVDEKTIIHVMSNGLPFNMIYVVHHWTRKIAFLWAIEV